MTTTIEFITALFYEVDEQLRAIPKHPEAWLGPEEGGHLGTAACPQRREGTVRFIGGSLVTIGCYFPGSPSGRGSFASS